MKASEGEATGPSALKHLCGKMLPVCSQSGCEDCILSSLCVFLKVWVTAVFPACLSELKAPEFSVVKVQNNCWKDVTPPRLFLKYVVYYVSGRPTQICEELNFNTAILVQAKITKPPDQAKR